MGMIRDMIKHQKNAIIAQKSEVLEQKGNQRFIKNGDDIFCVTDVLDEDSRKRCFKVEGKDGQCDALTIEQKGTQIIGEGYVGFGRVYFGDTNTLIGTSMFHGKDLNNINDIRYHLRNNEEALYFLDKFVIVTDEERKAYQEYAKAQDAKRKQERKNSKDLRVFFKSQQSRRL